MTKQFQYTKETECTKEPREVCGPESCPLVQGEKECETETKTVSKTFERGKYSSKFLMYCLLFQFVQQQPEENCDLISRKVCTPTMKVVPSMEPVTKVRPSPSGREKPKGFIG